MATIKTDATPYVHVRTKGRYLARHIGLAKIGDAKNWTECVMYQKAEAPAEWFTRSLPEFVANFVEERELQIVQACEALEIDVDHLARGTFEQWAYIESAGKIAGDITQHSQGKVGQDAISSEVKFIDRKAGFAITDNTIYILEGEEVILNG
jgi:hypothetical protein